MEDNKKKEQLPDAKPIEPNTSDPGIAVPEPAPVTLNQEQQLAKDYAQTVSATQDVYDQQIQSVDDFVKEAEEKRNALKQQDENYQKRENAYRYIAGLGDTLSGIANLVGTAHGASNQQQTYNGNMIAAKAEESRKARKLEMDKLNERVDEMKARSRELSAAKDLKTAELQAQYNREQRDLKIKQDALAREEAYKERLLAIDETNAQANLTRAEATANKPVKPKSQKNIKVMDAEGNMSDYDTSNYRNFDKDYQKALDAAIADGTSGLSDDEIEEYQTAVKLAKADSGKALQEFLRTHTYRKSIVDRMNGTGANNPKYQ